MSSSTSSEYADVIIVGAGFAGLGMGTRLARENTHSFLILERATEVGGTWRDNTYPGVACDVPSQLYSFSFRPKPDWSRVFAPGAEIAGYLRECARSEGLLPCIRFSTELLEARWDDRQGLWRLTTSGGDYTARVLVTAAGRLSEPRLPEVPGLGSFAGDTFHTAAWRHDVSLEGRRVGVVGTGASAVQLVPAVAEQAAELVVFQRSAPYIVPRGDRAYTDDEKRGFRDHPDTLAAARSEYFWAAEEGFAQKLDGSASARRHRDLALGHLQAQVEDPILRSAVTPDYQIGCKRVLFSNDYYPALARPNVTLEPSPVASVDESRVRSAGGAEFDLDVLIMATGFHTTQLPFASRIVGRNTGADGLGETLADHWSEGMTAFASTVVYGFPNLFIIDGPNASLGHNSAITMIETQIDYIAGALAFGTLAAQGGHPEVLEVSATAEAEYTAELDADSSSTVWLTGGCRSWYLDSRSGRQTLLWPGPAHTFQAKNGVFDPAPFR
ncbi:flavin-containing monooxygenase [Subtercola frigoramans]|uniref:Cation diffusion facilitator CzcD-associated flavoprotein CzcO n=1 Tax=Subtercola frigoramans TaxID=120298 RepID=A0ABS2L2I3_9MICO|nr:NAD(P)/FAD-dependent oxidoreductase [Subtercola frigoramans]MBM7471234.1 cation diffusion facilitator CzcD-associated flavoprotein CzcO [Subtercola frigoramans]